MLTSRPGATLARVALAVVCFFFLKGDGGCAHGPKGERWSVTIMTRDDVAAHAQTTSISGDLLIIGDDLGDVELPSLTNLGGRLTVEGTTGVTRIALPALTKIGYANDLAAHLEVRDNASLTTFAVPVLREVEALVVSDNAALATLTLGSLREVRAELTVRDNPRLPACEIAALLARIAPPPAVITSGNDDAATCP